MPIKVKQDDGSEIDAFTAEELAAQTEAKAKEAADAARAEEAERLREQHEAEIAEREEAHNADKKELEDLRKKDFNFKQLRDKKILTPEQEAEAKRVADDLKRTNERLDAIEKQPFESAKSSFIQNNIGADKELGEKFDFFFKKLSAGAKTLDDYNTALNAAFISATGGTRQPNTSGNMQRISVNENYGDIGAKVESQDSQNFGALLGLKPEDKKQFGAIAKTGVVPIFYQSPAKEKNV